MTGTLMHTKITKVVTVAGLALAACFGLGACGHHTGAANGTGVSQQQADPGQQTDPGQQADPGQQTDAVTGTVYWPDGQPAANATIDFYPNDYPYGGTSRGEVQGATDSQGRYAITGCGCTALGATYSLDYSRNGGNYCYIIMQDDNSYTVSATPGDVVNWTMVDMPCSRDYLTPSSVQSQLALMQSDPEITGGSWQQARANAGG